MEGQVVKHLCPNRGVCLHGIKLFLGQTSRLVKYLAGNGDLPDVVEGGSRADQGYLFLGKGVFVRDLGQML